MTKKCYLFILLFLISAAKSSGTELLQEADKSFQNKSYSEALQYYKQAYDNFSSSLNDTSKINAVTPPNNHLATYICLQMGACYEKMGKDDLAINVYSQGATENGNANSELEMRCVFRKSFLLMKAKKDFLDANKGFSQYGNWLLNGGHTDRLQESLALYYWMITSYALHDDNQLEASLRVSDKLLTNEDKRIYFKK